MNFKCFLLIINFSCSGALRVAASNVGTKKSPFQLSIPQGIKKVMIDIGLYNSIMKPEPDEFVVAIDASLREIERNKLYSLCAKIQRCTLINAAIGKADEKFLTLQQASRLGGSSGVAMLDLDLTKWPMDLPDATVPVISLKDVIDAIPRDIPISLCKTDTNGNDVYVLESAGSSLQRCQRLTTEIVTHESGPSNQYETSVRLATAQGLQIAKNTRSEKREDLVYNLYFERPEVAEEAHAFENSEEEQDDSDLERTIRQN